MSVWSSIVGFFKGVAKEAETIFVTDAPVVQTGLTLAQGLIVALVNYVSPGASETVAGVLTEIKNDFATVSTVLKGAAVPAGSSAAEILQGSLSSLEQNLNSSGGCGREK